jgi:hypothetical protein
MNDPVLNRKMFRATALRTRAIRPQRYNVGAGIMGVEGTPFFTNESQGMGPNETRTFTKGSKVYTVNSAGQVIKVDTLPIKYQAPKKENIFFRTAERLLDPEGYKKNIADVKRFGKYMATPDPYLKAGRGIASIGKTASGYLGTEALANQLLPEGGANAVSTGLMGTGIAQLAEGFGAGKIPVVGKAVRFAAGPGRLLTNPYVGIPVALTAAGIYGAKKLDEAMSRPKEFTETDGFLGPAGTKTYVESPYAKQKREYEEVMKIQDPREQELAMGNRPDLFSPMGPDDMMMSAPPLAGSELAQQQGGGAGGTTPPSQQPQAKAIPASAEKKDTDLNTQVNQSVVKKTVIKKDGTTKEIKNTGKDSLPSLSDRLLKFSQTDAGNMFMLKFAAGLLSGKGNFGEVVGNALNPAVDTFAAYKLKEDELAYKQLQALAELKGKQEFKNGMIRITDVDEQGNTYIRAVPAQIDKKTGETFKIENGQRVQVPLEYSNSFREINPGTELSDAIIGYTNTSSAKAIATFIEKLPAGAKGAGAGIKQFFNTIIGVGEGILQAPQSLEFDSEETEKQFTALDKKIKTEIFDKADQSTRDLLAQAKISETSLRYFLANAFKQKDRLTNVDLKLINDLVQTISLSVSGRDVTARMAGLQQLLDTKMFGFKEAIRDNGVSDQEFAKRFFQQPGTKIAVGFLAPPIQSETEKRKFFNDMSTREQEDFLRKKGFK